MILDGAVHRCIHSVCHLIEDHAEAAEVPIRFAASKADRRRSAHDEADATLDQNEIEMLEHIMFADGEGARTRSKCSHR